MSKTLEFKAFCFEAYRSVHGISGKQAMEIFVQYSVLEYLNNFYDVLHTLGRDYLVQDIDMLIKNRRNNVM